MDVEAHLELALELSERADQITMPRFRALDLQVSTKPDLTPVSEADEAVERALREEIGRATGHAVVGEEFGHTLAEDDEYRWIIDPIDGTKNYVRGVPIWATLIGLEHAGEMVVGVVSAPALHTRWWAGRGLGAFRNGDVIRASSVSTLDDAQVSFAWDNATALSDDGIASRLLDLSRRCWRTRGLGDFWQHMLVAEGAFDIGIDPVVALWDIAALIPVIEEAGGQWTTIAGHRDLHGESFVTTNGRVHDEVVSVLSA